MQGVLTLYAKGKMGLQPFVGLTDQPHQELEKQLLNNCKFRAHTSQSAGQEWQ